MREFDINQEMYDVITALESSQGWKMYQDWIKEELTATEELILTENEEENKVLYTWYDLLRRERAYLLAMTKFIWVKKDELKPWIDVESL